MYRKLTIASSLLIVLAMLLTGCSGIKGVIDDASEELSKVPDVLSSVKLPTPASTNTPVPPRGITGTISTGTAVAAATIPVSPKGGTLKVTQPGTPISDLEIRVPENSYSDTRQFQLSYAPVEKHSFGEAFNPATPLITIDNGGDYAAELIDVTIPVQIPDDKFAMAFYYDDKAKKLEGLPLVDYSKNSITFATRHFSSFIVSMIPRASLKKDIDTGFRPGIDDWQFVNYGSNVAPGGHCAGQSVTAMWYYIEQPDGQGLTLWNRYDNNGNKPATPDLWQDDSYAYRFASVVHDDIAWDSWGSDFMASMRGVNDELAWNLFAYSMQLTGEPQYVGLASSTGGAHAMIVYRIFQGNLYISDPNYPGNTDRRIEYNGVEFSPYESGANREEIEKGRSVKFDLIGYRAKTAMIDWTKISQRWQELKKGTIGSGIFPDYEIVWIDGKGKYQKLLDGVVITEKNIGIRVMYKVVPGSYYIPNIYRDGKRLQEVNSKIELNNGKNVVGLHVVANRGEYVDFKYVTVYFGADLAIEPAELTGKPDVEYVFNAVTGVKTDTVSFNWQVDGKTVQSGKNNKLATKFSSAGKHTVTVSLIDDKTSSELAKATAQAMIAAPSGGDESLSGKEVIRIVNPKKQSQLDRGKSYFFEIEMENIVIDDKLGNPVVVWDFGDGTTVESPFGRRIAHTYSATSEGGAVLVTVKLYYGSNRTRYYAMDQTGYSVVIP